MPWAGYSSNMWSNKICSSRGFVTYWLFVCVFHCYFMIYPWTANSMSWCSLYLLETRESGDEREEQKQENGLIDLIWISLSAVRVMMMMWVPVRIQAWSHTRYHTALRIEKEACSNCIDKKHKCRNSVSILQNLHLVCMSTLVHL